MRKIIIAEGPDGSGKSSTLEPLAKNFGKKIIHSGGPLSGSEDFLLRMEKFQDLYKTSFFDRTPTISELVYGELLRGELLVPHYYIMGMAKLLYKDALIIYCRPSDQTLVDFSFELATKAHKPQAHLDGVKDNILKIAHKYDSVIMEAACMGAMIIPYNRDVSIPKDLIYLMEKYKCVE